ncbi:ABC transporter permease [Siccirubricoccus deserti]
MPLILPGVVSGAIFAFATSFDEIVVTLFLAGPQQRTLPLQMFDGVREQISPAITAAATLLFLVSVGLVGVIELLRRRTERLRGRHRPGVRTPRKAASRLRGGRFRADSSPGAFTPLHEPL